MLDERDAAQAELDRIAALEGVEAETYVALAKAVAAYDRGEWDGRSY